MTEDLRARAEGWIREAGISGSHEDKKWAELVRDLLAEIVALQQAQEKTQDSVTALQIDKDNLNAEAERYKELLDAAIEDYNREHKRAEAAEAQLRALTQAIVKAHRILAEEVETFDNGDGNSLLMGADYDRLFEGPDSVLGILSATLTQPGAAQKQPLCAWAHAGDGDGAQAELTQPGAASEETES